MFASENIEMNKAEKLSDKIVGQLKNDIAQQKYKQGERIPPEPELMKLYGVGRSTIREAIKTLATEGTLKVQQGYGTIVNTLRSNESIDQRLKRADFDEINVVRNLLEGEIVALAVTHHTDEQITFIEQCLANRKSAIQAEQRQACVDADIAFHLAIAQASGNQVLAHLYEHFTYIIRDFFSKREVHGISHFAMSHHLHEQLYKAIKARKPKQAQQILKEILDNNY